MVEKETMDVLKTLLSIAGIIVSVMGIVVTLLAYFFISPIISSGEETVLKQVEGGLLLVASVEQGYDNVSSALNEVPAALNVSSSVFKSYAGAATDAAAGMDALALLNESISAPLRKSAESLRASSIEFNAASEGVLNSSKKVSGASAGLKTAKINFDKVERNLQDSKNELRTVFGNLKSALMLMTALLVLIFLALMAYSLSSAL